MRKYKYLRESETTTVVLTYMGSFRYEQYALSDRGFDANFDDYILWNKRGFDAQVYSALKGYCEESEDLAEYVGENLAGKVTSIKPQWSKHDYLEMVCKINVPFASIKEDLIDYLAGQISDGWGENFEQQELASAKVYAVYNEDDDNDCEFFDDWRRADSVAREKNEGGYAEYDEDDEETYTDVSETYNSCEVDLTCYCSFDNKPMDIFVNGYNEKGFDAEGRDAEGYSASGFDKNGFNREGYDRKGFDREGFDKTGYNDKGFDREGFDKSGKQDLVDTRPTTSKGSKAGALFQRDKSGKVSIRNTFDMGESRKMRKGIMKESVTPSVIEELQAAIDIANDNDDWGIVYSPVGTGLQIVVPEDDFFEDAEDPISWFTEILEIIFEEDHEDFTAHTGIDPTTDIVFVGEENGFAIFEVGVNYAEEASSGGCFEESTRRSRRKRY